MQLKNFLNFTIKTLVFLLLLSSVHNTQVDNSLASDFSIYPEAKVYDSDFINNDGLYLIGAFNINLDNTKIIVDNLNGVILQSKPLFVIIF
jgi:hypothetical protein